MGCMSWNESSTRFLNRKHKMYGMNRVVFFTIQTMIIVGTFSVPIRLKGGSGPHEGRLEVYVDGQWGTVADYIYFGQNEATVVCRQLGYPGLAFATKSTVFGQGSGPIAYRGINCQYTSGMPSDLEECVLLIPVISPGISVSRHINDVGVVCNVSSSPAFRLVGGSGLHEGRLEVFFRGQWGSVCYPDGISVNGLEQGPILANIVCRHLGFTGVSTVRISSTSFGSVEGPVWISQLTCDQYKGYLHQCVEQWGRDNNLGPCNTHTNDAAIICNASAPASDIRLVGGSGPHEGRLEIRHNGQWGSVCSKSATWKPRSLYNDAGSSETVCQQLGFDNGDSFQTSSEVFGQATGLIWLGVNFCSGSFDFPCISDAYDEGEERRYCNHSNDIGIICNVTSPPPVRLVGGSVPNEGFAEIQFRGEWGTICLDKYEVEEITAVCRRLGYSGRDENKTSPSLAGTPPSQRIWLSSVICLDDAARIDLCYHDPLGQDSCNYGFDKGVVCEASTPAAPIRLVGGSGPHEGRLEIFHGGEWGTVCVDDYQKWGRTEANVVCGQLGFRPNNFIGLRDVSQATSANIFAGTSRDKIALDSVTCNSSREEMVLKDCDHSVWGGSDVCDHSKDVGVVCSVSSSPLIRLVGGRGSYEGRLEIFFQGEWGTVCHEKDWEYDKLPETVCKQIGLSDGPSQLSRAFGQGEGRIWLDRVRCNGEESSIDSCQHSAWGGVTCDHSMDIGVKCDVIKGGVGLGLIIGVVLAILTVIIAIILVIFCWKRYHKEPENYKDVPMEAK